VRMIRVGPLRELNHLRQILSVVVSGE